MTAINIIFDGPPSNESGRFVEVENDVGQSIGIGEWIELPNKYWALRITEKDLQFINLDNDQFGVGA